MILSLRVPDQAAHGANRLRRNDPHRFREYSAMASCTLSSWTKRAPITLNVSCGGAFLVAVAGLLGGIDQQAITRAPLRRASRCPGGLDGAFYAPSVLTASPRDADHARGDLRTGAPGHRRRLRGRGGGDRQQLGFGLGASVWTSDRARGERISADLQSGMVWINDHMFSHGACQCAWGGVKDSASAAPTRSRAVRVRQRQAAGGRGRRSGIPGGTRTTRRSARRCADRGAAVWIGVATRGRALRDGAVPLTRLGARLARDAIRR